MKAKSIIRDLDPTNDLTFLRIKSKNNEIMVAPGRFRNINYRFEYI
jgi:dynein light chain roadblock-type